MHTHCTCLQWVTLWPHLDVDIILTLMHSFMKNNKQRETTCSRSLTHNDHVLCAKIFLFLLFFYGNKTELKEGFFIGPPVTLQATHPHRLLVTSCNLLWTISTPLRKTSMCSLSESVNNMGCKPSSEAEMHHYNSILVPYEPHSCLLTSSSGILKHINHVVVWINTFLIQFWFKVVSGLVTK